MTTVSSQQSLIRVSDDEARSSDTTHNTTIKIDLEEGQGWGLLRNEEPTGYSKIKAGAPGIRLPFSQISNVQVSHLRRLNQSML